MFNSLLNTDYINNLQDKAKSGVIKKNRDFYNEYFKIIEKYIFDNNLIISDIDTLIEKKILFRDDYKVFVENPFKHANNLTNLLAKETDEKWFSLHSSIPNILLNIKYKNKVLISINSLQLLNYFNIYFLGFQAHHYNLILINY